MTVPVLDIEAMYADIEHRRRAAAQLDARLTMIDLAHQAAARHNAEADAHQQRADADATYRTHFLWCAKRSRDRAGDATALAKWLGSL